MKTDKKDKADEHNPCIFSIRGTDFVMLACSNKFLAQGTKRLTDSSVKFETMYWPVVIQLKPQLKILHDFKTVAGKDIEWEMYQVPISKSAKHDWPFLNRAAKNALADAYRTVSEPKTSGWNGNKTTSITLSPEKLFEYKGGTMLRNVMAWLAWDEWKAKGLTIEQRAEILRNHGFTECTGDKLEKAAGKRGL